MSVVEAVVAPLVFFTAVRRERVAEVLVTRDDVDAVFSSTASIDTDCCCCCLALARVVRFCTVGAVVASSFPCVETEEGSDRRWQVSRSCSS